VSKKPEFTDYPGWPGYAAIRRSRVARPGRPPRLPLGRRDARCLEWADRPLGRLGRRLLPEIEAYAEFFAIASG
jgi:hypothetical protein